MSAKTQKKLPLLLPAPSLLHSGLKIASLSLWYRWARFTTPLHLAMAATYVYLALSLVFTVSFFLPRPVNFSFGGPSCVTSPTLLPNLISKNQGQTFSATPKHTIAIAGYPLYSHTTCVTPTQAPAAHATETITFNVLGIGFLKKDISVTTAALPTLQHQAVLSQPISTKDPLTLPLTTPDNVFEYQLQVNDQTMACAKDEDAVRCDVAKLGLQQSASYNLRMQRVFNGQPAETLFSEAVTTVGAVLVANSSIAPGQTVYDVPGAVTLTLNKPVKAFAGVSLSRMTADGRQGLPVTTTADGQTITVQFDQPLPRSAAFELSVESVTAPDGGHLPETFVLAFSTSGGPKVKGANIGSYKVAPSASVVLSFDTGIAADQALASFIKLEIGGNTVASSLSRSGNTVTINPDASLPGCTRFSVKVLDGLQNEFGISGGSAWQYNSRTICHSTFSIGKSVAGRSIVGYRFGSGASTILYVGTTHGNEKSSTYVLNSWIDYLEVHYDQIPAHRTIIVIPNLNPDGYAANQRTNAHNVDLNRNFPANNWKQGVTMPGGAFNANGGGNAPLSEPESSALANYIVDTNPRLVLTYHAAAGLVMPNDSGDSDALAKLYDQKSNLNYEPSSQTGAIFTYDTTGSLEEWLFDKYTIPTILVELWTKTSNEFSKNQNAMWYMATLP